MYLGHYTSAELVFLKWRYAETRFFNLQNPISISITVTSSSSSSLNLMQFIRMDPLLRCNPIRRHLLESPTDHHHHQTDHPAGREMGITVLLLATIILITSLLFSIYRCFVPQNPSPVHRPNAQNSCNSESESKEQRPEEVAALPVFVFGEETGPGPDSSDQESCAICLDEFTQGDCIKFLPKCKHIFHKDCIGKWLLSHSSLCPVCRDRAIQRNPESTQRNCRNTNNVVGGGVATLDIHNGPVPVAFNLPSFARI